MATGELQAPIEIRNDEAIVSGNKNGSHCHFGLQCLGCSEDTKDHGGHLHVCIGHTFDGSEMKIPVCKTAKVLVMRIGVSQYKAMIARHCQRQANHLGETAPTSETKLCALVSQPSKTDRPRKGSSVVKGHPGRCHFGSKCLGYCEGTKLHCGNFRVSVRRACDSSEEVMQVCRIAMLLMQRIGADEFEAMTAVKRV